MLIPDVNVLVAAYRDAAEHHEQARPWLESALSGHEPVGVTDAVLAGVVRIVTNPRIFSPPTATAIEAGATWVTFDRGFARFPGLRWRAPWEETHG